MANINKLKDKIKSTIYPNGKGAINASDHQAMLLEMADGMAETDTELAKLSEEINGENEELIGTIQDGNINNGGGITSSSAFSYWFYDLSALDKGLTIHVETTYKGAYTTLWALHSAPYSVNSGLTTLVAKGDLTSITQSADIDLSLYPNANYLYLTIGESGNEAVAYYQKGGLKETILEQSYKETYAKLVELTNKPAISWIDDDFIGVGYDGAISEQYQVVHDWCVANGIKCDFAIIPDAPLESMGAKLAVAKEWENENFNFLFHPVHSEGWYNYNESNPHDIEKVKRSIVTGIRKIRDYGLLCPLDIMVWPGDSHTFDDNIEVVKNYMDMAISVTQNLNHAADSPRYKIARIGIERLNKGMTMTDIKAIIDDAVASGDWMIFYTHIHSIVIANEVTETGFTTANLFELLRYANDRVRIRPSAAIWRERKIMWEMSGK